MTPRIQVAVETVALAAAVLWWLPTLLAVIGSAVATRARLAGITYRIRRAALLIDRGRAAEAEHTLMATRRDIAALAPRLAAAAP